MEQDDYIMRGYSLNTCPKVLEYQKEFRNTDERYAKLFSYYNETLMQPLGQKLDRKMPTDWHDSFAIIGEIIAALFDKRQLNFTLTDKEL